MIDIIIPVYNTPINDLERCLDSIIEQTFKDYKIYIIDDGSNKETKEYLDSLINEKITVKHIYNQGVSNARNIGIEISNSKYICFVDSDDTLESNFLEDAYELIENNNLDVIIGGYNEIKDNKIIRTRLCMPGLHIYKKENMNSFIKKLLSGKTDKTNKEIGDCPTGRIYNRLFKRESIGLLRFNANIHMSEDTLFMIDYIKDNKRVGIIDKVWYNYYLNDYSISNSTKKDKLINNINNFIKEIEIRMNNEQNSEIKKTYKNRIDKAYDFIKRIEE